MRRGVAILLFFIYTYIAKCESSSFGRMSPSQGEGGGFEPRLSLLS